MAGGRVVRRLVVWALVALWCAGSSACGDGDDTEGCLVEPEADEAAEAGTLVYSVSGTPLAKVFRIVYAAPEGEKTVENPQLPFSVSLKVEAGASMQLEVTGAADEGGSISAGYSFTNAAMNDSVVQSATCQR